MLYTCYVAWRITPAGMFEQISERETYPAVYQLLTSCGSFKMKQVDKKKCMLLKKPSMDEI